MRLQASGESLKREHKGGFLNEGIDFKDLKGGERREGEKEEQKTKVRKVAPGREVVL